MTPMILSQNFEYLARILQVIAIAIGLALFLGAFFKLKKYGEQRTMMSMQMTMAGPLLMIISGSALLILPTFIGTALLALWGNSNPLQYSGDTTGLGAFIPPILMFVRVIGVGSFIRGLVLLARSGDHQGQQGTMGKALIHILAGILCVNIVGTVDLLEALLGFTN